MPPTLLGASASASASTNAGNSARTDSAAGSDRRDFDALLKGDSASKDTPAKAKSSKPGSADTGNTAPGDAPKRPGTKDAADASDAIEPSTAQTAPATDKPAASEPADDAVAAPWPPLGLAGLALTGLEAVTVAAAPAANADATALAKADPLLTTLPATPATAPAAPALAGAAAPAGATDTAAATGAIALPLDAEVSDDTALPKTLADAIAATDPDAPTTPFLHALHAAAELKTGAASVPFSGDPTATPHVGGDDFDDAMSARIGWLADQKIGHAVIRVTPHDLGQIEVRLQMDGDKVHASFSSAHADVRHALESSIPRLREMLNDQGFQLGNADVGHQHTAQDGKAGGNQAGHGNGDGDAALVETTVSPSQLMRQRGLVDAYA
jgi:flagellar hook-length control protein FliK